MNYTTLSLAEVRTSLENIAQDAADSFGVLDTTRINWRPDATRWSVAQCLDHLVVANRLMRQAAEDALRDRAPRSLWQRLPVVPGLMGRMLIRSQQPDSTRKFTAPAPARPSASDISADIVERFVEQHRALVQWVQALDEARAERTVMTSPFVRVVIYSVLDGFRVIVAHDHRHLEQARRVTRETGFPRG